MIMSSYFNVFAPKNDKDLCWYRPKPHFASVSKLLEGSVFGQNPMLLKMKFYAGYLIQYWLMLTYNAKCLLSLSLQRSHISHLKYIKHYPL